MIRVKTYDGALMSGALPPFLDLGLAVRQELCLTGTLAVNSMPRLAAALTSDRGAAEVTLRAEPEIGGRVVLSGTIQARLNMTCQRCLAGVELEVEASPRLAWVRSEAEMEVLPPEYDPLLSADGRVAVRDLVEDELLLALPLVPRHTQGACRETRPAAVVSAPEHEAEKSKNAFAELAKLKRGR